MIDTQSPPRPHLRDPATTQAAAPDPERRVKRVVLLLCMLLATVSPALLALGLGSEPDEAAGALVLTVIPVLGAFFLLRPR